ncbi:MAG TPA: hypothetical protein ENH84_01275 [Phycisphaerae bacterium]|nr:hypothetical protein [Phycisphaerae bacterium]
MPITVECDGGCGATVPRLEDFERFGYAHLKYYCPECAEKMRVVLAEIDELHDSLAKKWRSGVNSRRKAFLKANPKAVLPDAS